jgi:AcrR family transcriptional regulator
MFPAGHPGVKMVPVAQTNTAAHTQTRPYRGVKAADRQAQRRGRLLDAGLTILGSDSGLDALTVRGVCRQAGLSARYFYESFADRDDFVGAVYDWVIADLAATTQAAVTAAPPREQARAGMANVVRSIAGDARVGRLLFSAELADPVVVRKRDESSTLLATLLVQHVGQTFRLAEDDHVRAIAHFTVGGVGQAITAWLAGQLAMTPDEVIALLASLLDQLADPAAMSRLREEQKALHRTTAD